MRRRFFFPSPERRARARRAGKGSDADVKAVVWILDSDKFPAFRAETYHQFHDGFARGENYPDAYNDLGRVLDLDDTACPPF